MAEYRPKPHKPLVALPPRGALGARGSSFDPSLSGPHVERACVACGALVLAVAIGAVSALVAHRFTPTRQPELSEIRTAASGKIGLRAAIGHLRVPAPALDRP